MADKTEKPAAGLLQLPGADEMITVEPFYYLQNRTLHTYWIFLSGVVTQLTINEQYLGSKAMWDVAKNRLSIPYGIITTAKEIVKEFGGFGTRFGYYGPPSQRGKK